MREKQEAIDKTFDQLSDLNISKSSPTKDLIDKEKDSFKNGDKISKNIVISEDQRDSATVVKRLSGSGEENEKLLASKDLKQEIAAKKVLSNDGESKALRQSDARQTVSSLKENVEGVQITHEEIDKVSTKQTSIKVVTKENLAEDSESKEDKEVNRRDDIKSSQKMQADEKQKMEALTERSTDDDKYLDDSARGKSADLSSTESRVSMLNVEDSLSPERTGSPRDKKSKSIKRDDRERLEAETGKSPKYIRILNIQKIIKT